MPYIQRVSDLTRALQWPANRCVDATRDRRRPRTLRPTVPGEEAMSSKPFFLIDFENVQPKALGRLKPGAARIKVFLGAHQSKLMLELVQALQPFGNDAEYIQITGSGPDAVDFHIAFYIGRLAQSEPGATFNIISKDRGFDPLVRHLHTLGIGCERYPEIPTIAVATAAVTLVAKPPRVPAAKAAKTAKPPGKKVAAKRAVAIPVAAKAVAKPAPAKPVSGKVSTTASHVAQVVAWLQKSSRPARLPTLRSSIAARFLLDTKAVDAVVQSLRSSRRISIEGTKVSYTL